MIETITARFAAWRLRRDVLRDLGMLSDRELADLGIGRGDIPAVAAGTLHRADPPFVPAPAVADGDLIGPAWAAHAPTALAA